MATMVAEPTTSSQAFHEPDVAEENCTPNDSVDNSWSHSKTNGRRVYPMPAIPEDNEITEENIPIGQEEILHLAMSGRDISHIPTDSLPKDAKRAIELLQFALSNDSEAESSSKKSAEEKNASSQSTSSINDDDLFLEKPKIKTTAEEDELENETANHVFTTETRPHQRSNSSLITPLENVVVSSDIERNLTMEMDYDVCSKSHLIFHRYGWKKISGRIIQLFSYLLFYSSFIAALSGLIVVGIFWSFGYSFQILFPGISLLGLLFAFNVYLGNNLYTVIHRSLQSKRKSYLGKLKPNGRAVIIKGLVSLLENDSYISNFNETSKCAIVQTCMKYRHHYGGLPGKWKIITRHLNAVDFRITDSVTGVSSVISAESAALDGQAHVFLHPNTVISINNSSNKKEAIKWVGEDAYNMLESFKQKSKNIEVVICESLIPEGQEVTVMGRLTKGKNNISDEENNIQNDIQNENLDHLCIEAMEEPHNVSNFFSFYGLIPFFYPTWITGLVISDQNFSEHNLD